MLSEEGHCLPECRRKLPEACPGQEHWRHGQVLPGVGSRGFHHHAVPGLKVGTEKGKAQGLPQPDTLTAALTSENTGTDAAVLCTLATCEHNVSQLDSGRKHFAPSTEGHNHPLPSSQPSIFFLFMLFIYFREEKGGIKKERERNINVREKH